MLVYYIFLTFIQKIRILAIINQTKKTMQISERKHALKIVQTIQNNTQFLTNIIHVSKIHNYKYAKLDDIFNGFVGQNQNRDMDGKIGTDSKMSQEIGNQEMRYEHDNNQEVLGKNTWNHNLHSEKIGSPISTIGHNSPIIYVRNLPTQLPSTLAICGCSVSRTLVQLTYLLYTCHMYKTDVYIKTQVDILLRKDLSNTRKCHQWDSNKTNPFGRRSVSTKQHNCNRMHEIYLYYYLAPEKQIIGGINTHNHNGFQLQSVSKNISTFNQILIATLQALIKKVFNNIPEKPSSQLQSKLEIQRLSQTINKYIIPLQKNQSNYSVIKHLQTTATFRKHSDLLKGFTNSIYYRIIKNKVCVDSLRKTRDTLRYSLSHGLVRNNSRWVYRIIDKYLSELIEQKLIHVEKSSTKDYKDTEEMAVGYIENVEGQDMQIRYKARFYSYELDSTPPISLVSSSTAQKTQESTKKKQSQQNHYLVEYNYHQNIICMRYITNLQANIQSIDIISNHCNNIMFSDKQISLQTYDILKNNEQGISIIRKMVVFKLAYRFNGYEEPLTKLLLLLEYVTLCAGIYMPHLIIKPKDNQSVVVEECSHRLNHMLRILGDKVENFYDKL